MREWRGGLAEGTPCGEGSLMKNAKVISSWLPDICNRFNIKTVCDAGAGDMHWIKHVDWDVDYKPYDLIPRSKDVAKLDITIESMPKCDAILCRMVFNHLDDDRIKMALDLFDAKYLIATQFQSGDREFQKDLRPWLGDPIEMSIDGHEDNCYLAIWEI